MECLETSTGLDALREANRSLRSFLAREARDVQGSDDDLNAMLEVERTLRMVGMQLDLLRRSERADVRTELELYRDNLLRLRRHLGVMQVSATDCQARLFIRDKHLRAAQEWCAATRSTG